MRSPTSSSGTMEFGAGAGALSSTPREASRDLIVEGSRKIGCMPVRRTRRWCLMVSGASVGASTDHPRSCLGSSSPRRTARSTAARRTGGSPASSSTRPIASRASLPLRFAVRSITSLVSAGESLKARPRTSRGGRCQTPSSTTPPSRCSKMPVSPARDSWGRTPGSFRRGCAPGGRAHNCRDALAGCGTRLGERTAGLLIAWVCRPSPVAGAVLAGVWCGGSGGGGDRVELGDPDEAVEPT